MSLPPLTLLADDERLFYDSVYEFADREIRPLVRDMDEHGAIPASLLAKLLPSLSTIRPPARQIGEVAAQQVLALGRDEQPAQVTELACELLARESA